MANCPRCNASKARVIEAHNTFQDQAKRIRRRCAHCDHAWTMYEITPETLDKYREMQDKFDRLHSLLFNEVPTLTCHQCHQWDKDHCSLDLPEAGGTFASECSYYYAA